MAAFSYIRSTFAWIRESSSQKRKDKKQDAGGSSDAVHAGEKLSNTFSSGVLQYEAVEVEGRDSQNRYLQFKDTLIDEENKILIRELRTGTDCEPVWTSDSINQTKSLLLLGKTGVGKTTTVEAIINLMFGVEFSSSWRYKVTERTKSDNEIYSQTDYLTVYVIPYIPGLSTFHYTLRIIDTPGLCDTGGIDNDVKFLTQQIHALFDTEYVPELHAVCLIVDGNTTRETADFSYVVKNSLSFLGKDVQSNLIAIFNRCTGEAETAKKILENNIKGAQPFYANMKLDIPSNFDDDLSKLLWKNFYKEPFAKLMHKLNSMKSVSSQMTKNVICLKEQLVLCTEELAASVMRASQKVVKVEQLRKKVNDIGERKEEFRNHTFYVPQDFLQDSGDDWNHPVIKCQQCKKTCLTLNKLTEAAVEDQVWRLVEKDSSTCKECSHAWKEHHKQEVTQNQSNTDVSLQFVDWKKSYETATKKELDQKAMKSIATQKMEKYRKEAVSSLSKLQALLKELRKICLLPLPPDDDNYFDYLIEGENQEKKEGFEERIDLLRELKQVRSIVRGVSDNKIKQKNVVTEVEKLRIK